MAIDEPLGYRCEVCSFELWHPLARLSCSSLGLYDDSRFPGRCILALDRHAEDITTIDSAVAHKFMNDVREAGRAILDATGAQRLNVAVLGNVEPHLHAHLIPRSAGDAFAKLSPWQYPSPPRPLDRRKRQELAGKVPLYLTRNRG